MRIASAVRYGPEYREQDLQSLGHDRGLMLLTVLLIAIGMLVALGTTLYLAYRETEVDFPVKHKHHPGART